MLTTPYYEAIQLIERLHRYFLDVLKVELDKRHIQDINNVQAMILYNIGNDELTIGELTVRGCYLGSNVSYNVKKMVENGYLDQRQSVHDKRSFRVKLSEKGQELKLMIGELLIKHENNLAESDLDATDLKELNSSLKILERFWISKSSGGITGY